MFKDRYFDSGKSYNKKGVYRLKEIGFLKSFIQKKSDEHYDLMLLEKWKLIKGRKKVLDAGCGRGQFIALNPYNAEVFGIDVIKSEVDMAKKTGLNVKYADLNKKFPFKDSTFDAIICSHVLEHITDPSNMMSEFRRVLKNGGKLLIAVPNFSYKDFYKDYTHKRPYPKEALFRLLFDYNFEGIRFRKGPYLNKYLAALFIAFPLVRHKIEKLFGLAKPWELLVSGINKK